MAYPQQQALIAILILSVTQNKIPAVVHFKMEKKTTRIIMCARLNETQMPPSQRNMKMLPWCG